MHILHSWRKSGEAGRGLHSAGCCGKRKAGRDAAHGTASSRHWVEPPIHSRLAWMAAPQRFMVPVRAQNGTCAHDDSIRSPRVGSGPIAISAMTNISDFNPHRPRGGGDRRAVILSKSEIAVSTPAPSLRPPPLYRMYEKEARSQAPSRSPALRQSRPSCRGRPPRPF